MATARSLSLNFTARAKPFQPGHEEMPMVSVKNGDAHIASLRDGRSIYLDGRLVSDHTEHPAFRTAVRSAAQLYDYQANPEHLERMTFVSPRTGANVNRMWQLPTCHADLVE